ncbi:MAG TPA: DUF2207 domain-containing protein [Propionibacteriaceae bacterium]|nr:DUF2207 domain-containing protein [Micropruina sp.]HBX82385.1 DUF2207 domain-containing protein [Propionibacteriaceae bacterium]HBY23086.1 DUF2207 domain-containing protein [Propionibacteriaceae bacterium]
MSRLFRLMLGLALALGVLALGAGPAVAKDSTPSSWKITRYDVVATVDSSGTAKVALSIDFDFARDAGHGPFVTLPLRQQIGGDPDHWRMLDVSNVTATSPSGAAADLQLTSNDDALLVRIGDERRTWTGVQSYDIAYTIRGLIAPKQAQSGLDEVNWNAVGPGWQVPLRGITASITGPVPVTKTACFSGESYDTPCQATSAGSSATFATTALDKGEPMQVVAGFPAGTFTGADARIEKRYWVGNMFPLTPATGAATGAATLLGLSGLWWYLRRNGDRAYAGLTPGVRPAPGAEVPEGRATAVPVAVAFTPPAGTRPGEVGVLLDATADGIDVTATIIDLSVRGYLTITPLDKKSYSFVRTGNPQRLDKFERDVLDRLFDGEHAIDTAGIKARHDTSLMTDTQNDLRERVTNDLHWFRGNPLAAQVVAIAVGVALIVAGVGVGFGLAYAAGYGLVGAALVITGLGVIASMRLFSARTAEGSVVLAQALGFRRYLETAEAGQIRFEEGIDVFSRYLPWAIVFGVTDHWVKVFQQLAAEGRYSFDSMGWYVGASLNPHQFADSMSQFSSSMSSAMTSATSGSSGGSGFSGGGGFGGGGGGGW